MITVTNDGRVIGINASSKSAELREAADALDSADTGTQLHAQIRAAVCAQLTTSGQACDAPLVERLTNSVLARISGEQLNAEARSMPPGSPIVSFKRPEDVAFIVEQHALEVGAEATLELLARLTAKYEEALGE